jgi:hypothetical protein
MDLHDVFYLFGTAAPWVAAGAGLFLGGTTVVALAQGRAVAIGPLTIGQSLRCSSPCRVDSCGCQNENADDSWLAAQERGLDKGDATPCSFAGTCRDRTAPWWRDAPDGKARDWPAEILTLLDICDSQGNPSDGHGHTGRVVLCPTCPVDPVKLSHRAAAAGLRVGTVALVGTGGCCYLLVKSAQSEAQPVASRRRLPRARSKPADALVPPWTVAWPWKRPRT